MNKKIGNLIKLMNLNSINKTNIFVLGFNNFFKFLLKFIWNNKSDKVSKM